MLRGEPRSPAGNMIPQTRGFVKRFSTQKRRFELELVLPRVIRTSITFHYQGYRVQNSLFAHVNDVLSDHCSTVL